MNRKLKSSDDNFRFPGQYFDGETELHNNWHRYYDPDTGRCLTPDPIGLAGGINPFVYSENNPVNYIDPMGLKVTVFSRPVASSNRHHLFAVINSPGAFSYELVSLAVLTSFRVAVRKTIWVTAHYRVI